MFRPGAEFLEPNSGPRRLTSVTSSLERSTHPPPSNDMEESRSFADVYDSQYRSMVQIARLTTGSSALAEDLVQDAFADLYRRFEQVRLPDAYLRRAVASRCTSWVRKRTTERRYLEHQRREPPMSDNIETISVLDAVHRLPARQRTAIVLRYFADWPEVDIAKALACRRGTVKSLLSRARTQPPPLSSGRRRDSNDPHSDRRGGCHLRRRDRPAHLRPG